MLADGTGTTREHRGRERTTVAIAQHLADVTVSPLAGAVVAAETERLDREPAERGGKLSDEQHQAIELACGSRPFVVIEGHAGTGKSTAPTGITRAHQAAGRQIRLAFATAGTSSRSADTPPATASTSQPTNPAPIIVRSTLRTPTATPGRRRS